MVFWIKSIDPVEGGYDVIAMDGGGGTGWLSPDVKGGCYITHLADSSSWQQQQQPTATATMQKVVLALAVVVALVAVSRAEEKYTTKYDNIDLEQILKNDRLLNKYFDCLMAASDAGCTADGKELKSK